jgi:excisionase family DNA binding protein
VESQPATTLPTRELEADRELASGQIAEGAPDDALDVLDVTKAASLLRVCRNTVYALVGRNAIPHRRLGKQIRFHRPTLVRWLASWSLRSANERR